MSAVWFGGVGSESRPELLSVRRSCSNHAEEISGDNGDKNTTRTSVLGEERDARRQELSRFEHIVITGTTMQDALLLNQALRGTGSSPKDAEFYFP